jgi:two-component system heavy metal sensor histidine kinase CusS
VKIERLKALSLTARLTLFFTLTSVCIVLGLGSLLMYAADQHFIDLDRFTLSDKQLLIKDILTKSRSQDDARKRLSEALNHHHGMYISAKGIDGSTLYSSDRFSPPGQVAPGLSQPDEQVIQRWQSQGREYRALRMQQSPGYAPTNALDVVVAIDTKHHDEFIAQLGRTLAIYTVLAMIASGMFSWFAAHQGLAPLRAMKSRAATVSGRQLDERMPVGSVPIEMADLAKELNSMLDRLQSDFQRLSDFSSDLAHELRTPISNLMTQTQVVLSSQRDTETYRDTLASNVEEFQRLARMVSDMLFLAKTERSFAIPQKEHFQASSEIQKLVEFYDAVAEEKFIRINVVGDDLITGDRLMFRRAVSNLLSNALRHTPSSGDVCISVRKAEPYIEVAVANSGEDIDPKVLPRLFDRFFRADPARAHPSSDGAGLGLSITRAIVEAHSGKVAVTSEHGRTCFTLSFPVGDRANPTHA